MKIQGAEKMSSDQLRFEIQRGAKIVCYQYCISVLVLTFRRSSGAYFVPAGESAVSKGLPWTLLSVVGGWWGIPWGPIFTIQSLVVNFQGGKDLTKDIAAAITRAVPPPLARAQAAK
jgi:hypothetical protein